ncbi:dorsal-ventral patterning protein tolloid-like [Asterias amurensis]|uniref:dorsal-ventral patterning protein tolloid-like n=1 Tax=Asterias amurensis TaxID=7602 RepID=UPI003AB8CD71
MHGGNNCGSPNISVGTNPVSLTSPGYPGVYPNSIDCQWEIRAPDWVYVVVSIQDFYTWRFDFVYIDGTLLDGHSASIGLHRTTRLKSIAFTSLTSIRFATDEFDAGRGFLLQLQGTNDTSSCHLEDDFDCRNGICVAAQTRCDGNLDCRFGPEDLSYVDEEDCDYCGSSNVSVGTAPVSLTSPGYPGDYLNSIYCQWEIRAPDWVSVVVSIQDFYTEEGYDFVYIDGTLLDGHTASIKLNGITQLKSIAFTSLTTLYIRFTTSLTFSERGFLLQLQGTNDTTSCHLEDDFDCRNGICVAAQTRCDGNLDCRFGPEDLSYVDEEDCDYCGSPNISVGTAPVNLTSPGYPEDYPNSIDCQWEIRAPDWVSVVVSIQDFSTELLDYVYIDGTLLDGHTASIALFITTRLKSIAFTSLTSIRFAADEFDAGRGFLLQLQGTNDTSSCHLEDDFDCRNRICVAAQARCDGNLDCRFGPEDLSYVDEEDCGEDHSINVGVIVALVAVIVVFAVGVGFGCRCLVVGVVV